MLDPATMRNTTLSRRQGGHAAVAHAVAAGGRCVSCGSAAAAAPSALERPAPAAERVNAYARDWCRSVLQRVAAHTPQQQQQEHQHAGRTHADLKLLDDLYEQLEETFYSRRGYLIPKRERALVDATGGSATYGEVMPEGMQAMINKLHLGPDSVFVDLGSGLGRAVVQVALTTPAKKAIGIELSATRHEQAAWVVEQLQQKHGRRLDHVQLLEDDITSCSYQGGTHFLLCSTAFSASGCKIIAQRLAETPSFQVLVTSRQLPPVPLLRKVGEFPCAYSWNLGGIAHVYVRQDPLQAPAACLAEFLSVPGVAWLPHAHAVHVPIAAEEAVIAAMSE